MGARNSNGDEDELIEALKQAKMRGVNGYWSWLGDRRLEERGVALDVLSSAGYAVHSLVSCQPDPPDCTATLEGVIAGIEVTELVHRKALERSLRGQRSYFTWDRASLTENLQGIVSRKSDGRWFGGPYQKRVLVIHSDEFALNAQNVADFLQNQPFTSSLFTDVVLGLSYDPHSETHPTFRLQLIGT